MPVTLSVTLRGSFCIADFPVNFGRQLFSQKEPCQPAAQFGLSGLWKLSTQTGQCQGTGGLVELHQHVHLTRGAGLPPQLNLQGFYFRMGIGARRVGRGILTHQSAPGGASSHS